MGIINVNGGALYQWDTDRTVEITPWQNYTVDEVQFENRNSDTAIPVEPKIVDGEVVAPIPNILLQTAINIRVYAVMHTDGGERTIADCTLAVIARQRPADYVYTETEVKTYTALEKRVKALEDGETGGTVTDEQIASAVESYLDQNPVVGTPGKDGVDGKDGQPGQDGQDGLSAYQIWLNDGNSGTEADFLASLKGAPGQDGPPGKDGADGKDGQDGEKGEKGDPYTLTDTDKAAIVADVIESLGGSPVFGYVDENNNIIVSGNLADGTYTLKYENEDGTYTEVGTLELGAMPEPEVVVNLLDTAYDTDLQTVYNGVGYMAGKRVSNSGGGETTAGSATDTILTGLIPLGSDGDVLHVRGVTSANTVDGQYSGNYSCWDADGNFINPSVANIPTSCIGADENGDISITMTHSAWTLPEGTAYIRLQFYKVTGDGFIITRNQLITV